MIVDASSRDIAKLSETASLVKEQAPSFHLLSGQVEETGRLWASGDQAAKKDLSLSDSLLATGVKSAEGFYLTGSLGDPSLSGAGPVMLDMLTDNEVGCSKVLLAVLPAEDEPDLVHFNAYCGISRFLRLKYSRNADFIILLNERHVQENRQVDTKGHDLSVAETIASILSFLTNPRSSDFTRWLAASDLPNSGRLAGTIHAVPCLALNRSARVFNNLSSLLESATAEALVKVDMKSVVFAPVYLRIAGALKDKMKQEELLNQYNAWKVRAFGSNVGGELSLAYVKSNSDKIDALVLLGNCDLGETLEHTIYGYQRIKEAIISRNSTSEESLDLEGSAFAAEDLSLIEKVLGDYVTSLNVLLQRRSTGQQG